MNARITGHATESFTRVTETEKGRWRVEVGIGHLPYGTVVLEFEERQSGNALELICTAVTIRGDAISDSLIRGMADDFSRFEDLARSAVAALHQDGASIRREPVRRHRRLTDDFLHDIERRHAKYKAADNPAPTAAIAAEEGVTVGAVKAWLRKARG